MEGRGLCRGFGRGIFWQPDFEAMLAACEPAGFFAASVCHLPVTQFMADYYLGKHKNRWPIGNLRVCAGVFHNYVHKNCE